MDADGECVATAPARRLFEPPLGPILLVAQSIDVAAAVAAHAHILQNGEIAFSGPAAGLLDNPAVFQSYLGR
jgi:ABC-type branched-subunit amino acid transport system ATPase component